MPSLKSLWENISLIYLIPDDCHTKAEQWSRGKGLSTDLLQGLEFPILSNSWDNCKKETILSWSKGEAIVIKGDVNAENKAAGALTICYSAKQGSTVTKLQCYVTLYCKPMWGVTCIVLNFCVWIRPNFNSIVRCELSPLYLLFVHFCAWVRQASSFPILISVYLCALCMD